MNPEGIYVPLVTPFRRGRVDFESHASLVNYMLGQPINGLMMFGTTGEFMSLTVTEMNSLVEATLGLIPPDTPLYLGVARPSTEELVRAIQELDRYPVAGFLVGSPSYCRPSQAGITEHYRRAAGATNKTVLLYNIPMRTSTNIANETAFALSSIPNITGIKDVCADIVQTTNLLRERPAGFAVLAGHDPTLFTSLSLGADGAVLASAHVATGRFAKMRDSLRAGDLGSARREWFRLLPLISALFQEPSPVGIKYALARLGVIASPEPRLPLLPMEPGNAANLDVALAEAISPGAPRSHI